MSLQKIPALEKHSGTLTSQGAQNRSTYSIKIKVFILKDFLTVFWLYLNEVAIKSAHSILHNLILIVLLHAEFSYIKKVIKTNPEKFLILTK